MTCRTHKDHAKTYTEPLVVDGLIHCGQSRLVDSKKGVNIVSRQYRIEPYVPGHIIVTEDVNTRTWSVSDTFGESFDGVSLLNSAHIQAAISTAKSWRDVENGLASYFECCVLEVAADVAGGRRVRASHLGGGAGQ